MSQESAKTETADDSRSEAVDCWAGSDPLVDEVAVCRVRKPGADAEQRVESRRRVTPPVPAEHELVEVSLEMRPAQSMVRPQCPTLEVREHAVGPDQNMMSRCHADDLGIMFVLGEALIAAPAVRDHRRPAQRGRGNEGAQARRRVTLDRRKANPTRVALGRQLDRARDQHLALRTAALSPERGLFGGPARQCRLVDLDKILQGAAIGIDHGTAQLLKQQPRGLVAAKSKLGLKLKGRNAVGVACHDVNGGEPGLQRQMAAVHDRSGGDGGLLAAGSALPGHAAALDFPTLFVAA